jgi:Major Facilitator Superfamily
MGVLTLFFLPDDPETASFLNGEERLMLQTILARQTGHTVSGEKIHWADVKSGMLDWKTWMFAFAQFGVNTMWYGYSTFLPTIIDGLGTWTTAQVQLLTIPCYSIGAITYLVISYLSDTQGKRAIYSCGCIVVSIVGYSLLLANISIAGHYVGCFIVAIGLYVAVGLPLAWLPSNTPRYGKRAFSSGFQLTVGSFGGVSSPFVSLLRLPLG